MVLITWTSETTHILVYHVCICYSLSSRQNVQNILVYHSIHVSAYWLFAMVLTKWTSQTTHIPVYHLSICSLPIRQNGQNILVYHTVHISAYSSYWLFAIVLTKWTSQTIHIPVYVCVFVILCLARERNVLFNDALNTFYLRLYGVRHMVKDHSDSERGNPLPPHRLLFPISSKGSFICTIPQTG